MHSRSSGDDEAAVDVGETTDRLKDDGLDAEHAHFVVDDDQVTDGEGDVGGGFR